MANYSHVTLVGRLTGDPETKQIGELTLATFCVAINSKHKDNEEVAFIDVRCWQKTAEIAAKYCKKGRAVLVGGSLKMDSWDDKVSGQKRTRLYVLADQVQCVEWGDSPKKPEALFDPGEPPF